MTDFERLWTSSEDDLERALLGSVLAEAPSSAGLHDAALALGLTATTATALLSTLPHAASALAPEASAATVPLATSVAPSAVGSGVAATASAASLATLGKSLLGSAVLSFLALTTVDYSLQTKSAPTAGMVSEGAEQARPREPGPAPVAERGTVSALAPPSAMPAEGEKAAPPRARRSSRGYRPLPSAPVEELAAAAPPVVAPPEAPPPPPSPTATARNDAFLAAEIKLLDRTRGALARNDAASASALLARYYESQPSPVLAHEAALLRIRLLLAQGKRAAAAAQARRIIATYPENAHAESLRRLAAEP
jgi:hypothetical protein